MTDNRTTELREKLDNLIIELDRLDITLDSPASDMTIGEYEQEREKLLDGFIQAIAATLGSERETELQDALNEVADKWARAQVEAEDYAKENLLLRAKLDAATHGTLTAEQVREAIMSVDSWEKPMGNTGLTNTHLIIRDDAWQAIADELNAELGSGTCSIVKTWSDSDYVDDWRYRCSECGCFIPVNERDPETGDVISAANFCPNCGRKVVSA